MTCNGISCRNFDEFRCINVSILGSVTLLISEDCHEKGDLIFRPKTCELQFSRHYISLFLTNSVYLLRARCASSAGGAGTAGSAGSTSAAGCAGTAVTVTVSDTTSAVAGTGTETGEECANLAGTRRLAHVDTETAGIGTRSLTWWESGSWRQRQR